MKDFLGELPRKDHILFQTGIWRTSQETEKTYPPGLRPKPAVPKRPKLPAGGKTPVKGFEHIALPGSADDAAKGGTKNIFQQGMDWLGNTSKNLMSKGKNALKGMKGTISSGLDSVNRYGQTSIRRDADAVVDDAIKPIAKFYLAP